MYKELIISIVIIIIIIIADNVTQNYTKKTVQDICSNAETLKKSLQEKDDKKIEESLSELEEKLNKTHDNLEYYIEHDEIENVETNFIECKSLAKSGNYDLSISKLEKIAFILDHIADKYSFSLENIF